MIPVSYTHLDVYKRQVLHRMVVENPPEQVPELLIDAANDAGGPDNITVVLLTD